MDKELGKMSNAVSAGMSEMEILLKASSIAHLASQTAMNCQQKVAAQEKIKHLTEDRVLKQEFLMFSAIARCDPQVAAELKQSVREIDPIAPLLAAKEPNDGESPFELQLRQQSSIVSMVAAFIAAFRLEEYALLTDWIKKFSDIPTSFARHTFANYYSLLYQASIANKKGNYSESKAILSGLLEHPEIVQNPTERLKVLAALVETEIRAGDSRKSFEAYLQWQQDVSSQRQTRNGVRPATPESAELMRLERRVALGEGIGAQDHARIRALIQRVPIQDATPAPMVTVDSIEKSVPLDSSLVVYFMSPGLAAAWVREPGKELTLVKLTEDIDSLMEDINSFSHNVQSSDPGWRDDGGRLYAKLIAPLGPLEGGRIVIVPSRMMERLPFDALGRKDGNKLIEEKSIVVLPSLLSGYAHRVANHAQADPLIIGVNGEGLTRAVDEANAVAKLLGTKALTGPAARLESVGRRLETAPIIHLSTHALLDIDNPFESRIELGDPSEPIKGWWLFSQPINARLVTLSACETARGNLGRGEGFPSGLNTSPSLADTFHIAGVQYVVGTMWKVDDNYALPLMTRFYQELKTANGDPTVALSSAKRAMIQDGQANVAQLAGFQISVRSLTDLETGR